MASGPITSWQIDGETMKTVRDFVLGGSKMTADGDCSHEIKRRLLVGRKAMTNLDNILKSWDTALLTKVHLVKSMVFSSSHVWMWELDYKEIECRRIDASELGVGEDSWASLGTERRSNQWILKEISPEYSLAGLMLKLQYFGQLMWRTDWLEKTLMLRKIESMLEKGVTEDEVVGWHHQLNEHEFEQSPGVGDKQGGLECCSPRWHKESDTTDWTEQKNPEQTNPQLLCHC